VAKRLLCIRSNFIPEAQMTHLAGFFEKATRQQAAAFRW
jgi:hypothetical protein